MAGIGFEIRKLSRQRGMLAPVASLGHATVIAAGPWILTVIALGIIQSRVTFETEWRSTSVQALIIYGFALSLIATAPVTAVAVRAASDEIYLKRFHSLVPIFLHATLVSTAIGLGAGLAVFGMMSDLALADLTFAVLATGILCAMWPALAFCGTVRRYAAISRAFMLGLLASVGLTFLVERLGLSAASEAFAFALGLGLTTILLQAAFLGTFADIDPMAEDQAASPDRHDKPYGLVALGAVLSALGMWADTAIMWAGPLQVLSREGLATAPFYDSVMFIARLSMVPALAFFVVWVETAVFEKVQTYVSAIRGTGTLDRILGAATDLQSTIRKMITSVLLVQLVASCALALLAHAAIESSGLLFQQTGLLRNGAIGALFHVIFLAATTILLFLDRVRSFAVLQGLFLVLNAGLTAVVTLWIPDAYGLGYLIAAGLSAVVAVLVLEDKTENLASDTFADAYRSMRKRSLGHGTTVQARLSPQLSEFLTRHRRQREADTNPPVPPLQEGGRK